MWNARALLFGDATSKIRKQKIKEVAYLCQHNSIVAIFESHGDETSILCALERYVRTHVIFSSHPRVGGIVHKGMGGVVILIHKDILGSFT